TDVLSGEEAAGWSLESLTDGLTESGRILDLPEWIAGLELRRDLENERLRLQAARTDLLQRTYNQMAYGGLGSVAGLILLSSLLRGREPGHGRVDAERMHEEWSRDMHDEVGSYLGCITFICSLATQADATRESIQSVMAEIDWVEEETANSLRYIVNVVREL